MNVSNVWETDILHTRGSAPNNSLMNPGVLNLSNKLQTRCMNFALCGTRVKHDSFTFISCVSQSALLTLATFLFF